MNKPIHAYWFKGGRHILKCGAKNGHVHIKYSTDATCKNCLRVQKKIKRIAELSKPNPKQMRFDV